MPLMIFVSEQEFCCLASLWALERASTTRAIVLHEGGHARPPYIPKQLWVSLGIPMSDSLSSYVFMGL